MQACNRAVFLAHASRLAGSRDSRGLALALTGKADAAKLIFRALTDWCKQNSCSATQVAQREEWMAALKAARIHLILKYCFRSKILNRSSTVIEHDDSPGLCAVDGILLTPLRLGYYKSHPDER